MPGGGAFDVATGCSGGRACRCGACTGVSSARGGSPSAAAAGAVLAWGVASGCCCCCGGSSPARLAGVSVLELARSSRSIQGLQVVHPLLVVPAQEQLVSLSQVECPSGADHRGLMYLHVPHKRLALLQGPDRPDKQGHDRVCPRHEGVRHVEGWAGCAARQEPDSENSPCRHGLCNNGQLGGQHSGLAERVSGCTPCGMCSFCLVPPASHIMVRGALVWLGVGWCAPGCTLLACCGLGGGWVAAVWPLWLGGCPGLLDPLLLVAVWLVPGPAVPGYSAPLPASSVVALVFGRRVVARAVAGRPLFGGARVSSLLGWCIPLWSLGILTRCSFLRLLCSVLVAVF